MKYISGLVNSILKAKIISAKSHLERDLIVACVVTGNGRPKSISESSIIIVKDAGLTNYSHLELHNVQLHATTRPGEIECKPVHSTDGAVCLIKHTTLFLGQPT